MPRTAQTVSFRDLYEVIETIGRGSFGEVIQVRRKCDQKVLVCKVLRYGAMKDKQRQLVVSEVNILRELRHPNIVRYHDRIIDKRSAKLYIVMEYCEGGDLGRHIKRKRRTNGRFEESRIWRALAELLSALEVCHLRQENGKLRPILHRDVKPCNIFLDRNGSVKLGDFGLAKELDTQDHFATTNVGTPYYMSPELINERKYNDKSDIWSIGCLIYEMAALRPPFEALNVVSLGRKISSGKFARIPSHYSRDLQLIIEEMLKLNPNERPSISKLLTHPLILRQLRGSSARSTNVQEFSNGRKTKPQNDSSKELNEYLTARFEDLRKREEALKARETALEARERRIIEREELIAQKERMCSPPNRHLTPRTVSSFQSSDSDSTIISERLMERRRSPLSNEGSRSSAGSRSRRSTKSSLETPESRENTNPALQTPVKNRTKSNIVPRVQSVDEIIEAVARISARRPLTSIENISPMGYHRTISKPRAHEPTWKGSSKPVGYNSKQLFR